MGTFSKILNKIVQPAVDYQPLIEVRIFRDALLHNLHTYQKAYPKLQFAPVLKSNAYGHGLVEVAGVLDSKNHPHLASPLKGEESVIPFFMVDSFYEALVLRRAGIKTKILVLGYCRPDQLTSAKLKDVSFGIIDLQILKNLAAKIKKPLNIHLKIDTGMHRQGILLSEISEAIATIKSNANIIVEGLCTHFADADGADDNFTLGQIEKWNSAAAQFRKEFPQIKYFHASNTAGAAFSDKIDANVSRLGIGLYGINTTTRTVLDLKPALEMVSIISSIKHIPVGEKVGYGITYTSEKNMIVATVPVGYNEGIDRRLSNKGSYKIKNVFCPIVGRVSMNMCSVDVSEVPTIKIEDEVVVISASKNDKNSVENLANLCDCISHEILVKIPQHLRRTII